eukprot:CAMPEP_0176500148 /NCGR_PEP_ID=MMETSP0200_2-20121128/13358_1 /TAXON_ID=947934 /ORGANISM="Chaetoceros sp., Strain GSL56" /LENGTH=528 /DNA_ID=CAMNT_0017898719 /DNA_START=91 /DNA_END=1677 /DNA_ORIENTATION=-
MQQEFKSDLQPNQAVSLSAGVVKDDSTKSTSPATTNNPIGDSATPSSNATAPGGTTATNTNTNSTAITNNATTTTTSIGQKRNASIAFQEPTMHTSSSLPTLLQSSFHLPFQSTFSNLGTTESSTGSDYSGNDDSYTITNQPQQSIACNTSITDGSSGLGLGSNSGGQMVDLTPINRNGKNLTEKKIRRLEKNRLSARNCRRKKKEYTQNLQREIMMLEGENLRLRLQLQIGQEAEQSTIKEQEKVTEGIDELLKSGAPDSEIYNSIEMFQARFADYGRDRRSAIEFHLRNVERLLMPTTTTSVAMRALQGGSTSASSGSGNGTDGNDGDGESSNDIQEEFQTLMDKDSSEQGDQVEVVEENRMDIDSNNVKSSLDESQPMEKQEEEENGNNQQCLPKEDRNSDSFKLANPESKELFSYLVEFLGVTPEQAVALKDSRHVAKELDSALEKSLSMLRELRERLHDMGQDLDAEFTAVRSILTPRQAAKFLVWVANNGACMSMLNELWSKVYPEPVVGINDDDDDDGDYE